MALQDQGMRLHAASGMRGHVVDLDTGRDVRKVIWLDLEAGELEAYQVREYRDGRCEYIKGINGEYLTVRMRGRFRLETVEARRQRLLLSSSQGAPGALGCGGSGEAGASGMSRRADTRRPTPERKIEGASRCARCPSVLTLPGDDLCVQCRARERGQRNQMLVERITTPLLNRRCEHYGCGRLATWSVSDEVEVSPVWGASKITLPYRADGRQRIGKALFTRGACVGRRWYCSWHYQPPRNLDPKGEVIRELEDGLGVRPE